MRTAVEQLLHTYLESHWEEQAMHWRPEDRVDRIKIGGLMRCCLETIDDLYAAAPAHRAADGDRLQCKYAADNPLHRMIFRDGCWEWDHE